MYLIEIKIGDQIFRREIYTVQQLGELIQSNMSYCHYIKILEYKPDKKVKKRKKIDG